MKCYASGYVIPAKKGEDLHAVSFSRTNASFKFAQASQHSQLPHHSTQLSVLEATAMDASSLPSTVEVASSSVLLSLLLPSTGDALEDSRRFRTIWTSLLEHNPALFERVSTVFLLSEGGPTSAAAREVSLTLPRLRIACIASPSLGRCFNDLFMAAVASDAPYLLHWDDQHVCHRPFWLSATAVMEYSGRELSQLQLTDDWSDLPSARVSLRDGHFLVAPHPDRPGAQALNPEAYRHGEPFVSRWPVWSLRPSLNRLSKLRAAYYAGMVRQPFDEAMSYLELQWSVGRRFEALGCLKGVLQPHAAVTRWSGRDVDGDCVHDDDGTGCSEEGERTDSDDIHSGFCDDAMENRGDGTTSEP